MTLHRCRCAGWLLLLVLPGGALAQTPLSLADAVESALAGHPALAASRAELAAAGAGLRESQAAWLPALGVSGTATRYEEPMVATPLHGFGPGLTPVFDRTLLQGAGSLSYTLFDGPGRPSRIRQSRALSAAAAARLDADAQAIAAGTLRAYLDALSQAEQLAAQDARLAALAAETERVAQREAVGKAAAVERLRLDATVAAAEAQRVHFATGLDAAERELARLSGRPLAECRRAQLLTVALRSSELPDSVSPGGPTLVEADARIAAAAAGAGLARSARWPQVKLAANLLAYDSPAIEPLSEWNAGLAVSLPLFTGGAIRARVAQAEAALAASRARREALRLATSAEDERARRALEEARAQAASLRRAVSGFAEVERIERLALEVGTGDSARYLDAEASLAAARAGLIEAEHREIVARVELARVAGELDLAWILRELEQ